MGKLETRAKREKIGAALSRQSSPATNLVSSLQRYAGNRVVQELLANRKPAVPEAPSPKPTVDLRSRMRSGMLVQRVATWGGDFDTRTYTAVKDGAGTDVGVDIQLEFKPGKMVESSHIGMVQMVNSKDLGVPLPLNATVKGRSIGKGADAGAHIDQLQDFRNPIYYTQKGKKGDRLSSTKSIGDIAGGGRPGWRHKDAKTGKISTRSARLNDTPQLPGRGANAIYVGALRDGVVAAANAWSMPGELDGPAGQHLVKLGAAAESELEGALADSTAVTYAGSREASIGNSYKYRVKDIAAQLLRAIRGDALEVDTSPSRRDRAIRELRKESG